MRLVGAFLHVMRDPGCDWACMLILPSKGIVGLLRDANDQSSDGAASAFMPTPRRGAATLRARRVVGSFGSLRPTRPEVQIGEAIADGSRGTRPCIGVSGEPPWRLSAQRGPRRPARRR